MTITEHYRAETAEAATKASQAVDLALADLRTLHGLCAYSNPIAAMVAADALADLARVGAKLTELASHLSQ